MATSEPLVTTLASAAGVQQTAADRRFSRSKPAWAQAALDFLTISVGLVFTVAIFGSNARLSQLSTVSVVAVATMFVTLLAFSDAYAMRVTPINIGDTEALVRGSCCGLLLFFFGSLAIHTMPPLRALITATTIVGLLLARRELVYVLTGTPRSRRQWLASGRDGSTASDSACHCQPLRGDNAPTHLVKRALDVIVALVLLILAMPMLVLVAVLIRLDSPGPALIRQRRIGRYGVPFFMWKFRSMRAEVCRYAPSPVSDADPRLTRCGRALRRFSIDEIPQLLNVLRGDMSLVGPRPEMPFIAQRYDARERLRLDATPGITGLWQISPARAMPIHENLQLDLFYIRHRNVFLDVAILLRTVTAVFRGIGAN